MQLKLKTRYALRILIYLAQNPGYINIETLARQTDVPHMYLNRIVGKLREAKIVEAINGCKGGWRLRQAPQFVSLYDVIAAVDDLFQPTLSPPEEAAGERLCEQENDAMLTIQNALQAALCGVKLDRFCDIPSAHSRYPAHRTHADLLNADPPPQRQFG